MDPHVGTPRLGEPRQGKKELTDFMPDLLRNPKTPPEEIRRIAESTGAVDPDVRRIAADVLAALHAEDSHAESAESEAHAEPVPDPRH